jgi:hypothetical protein
MILTYTVYTSLFLIMFYFSIIEIDKKYMYYTNKNILNNPFTIIPIIFFTIFIGLRYNVGTDYLWYKKNYETHLTSFKNVDEYFEIGYLFIIKILTYLNLNFKWLFITTAFLQIYFFYKQSRNNIFLFPFIIFFFFVTTNFMYSLNIMRQMIAFNIIFFGTKYIISKKPFSWVSICLFASLFHSSVLITILFYFLNINLIKSKYKFFFITVLFFLILKYLVYKYFNDYFFNIFNYLYKNYTEESFNTQIRDDSYNKGSGYVDIALFISYFIFFTSYDKCFRLYKRFGFALFFNLSLIGIILFPLIRQNILLDRVNYYFFGFRFIIFSFYSHYYLTINKNIFTYIFIILFMMIFLFTFINDIYVGSNNISPYIFIN